MNDQLHHDPVLAPLAGKLTAPASRLRAARRQEPLNRFEHAPCEPSRYHQIGHDGAAIERLLVDLCLEANPTPQTWRVPGEALAGTWRSIASPSFVRGSTSFRFSLVVAF